MMRYEDQVGDVYEGETAAEVVQKMMDAKLTPPKSRASYRRATARRVSDMGLQVDASSDTMFLESLVKCGLLTVR